MNLPFPESSPTRWDSCYFIRILGPEGGGCKRKSVGVIDNRSQCWHHLQHEGGASALRAPCPERGGLCGDGGLEGTVAGSRESARLQIPPGFGGQRSLRPPL